MATFNRLNGFVEHLAEKVHNLGSDALTVALSNTAPGSESTPPNGSTAACVLANVTQISYTNLSSRVLTVLSSGQTGGTYALSVSDLVLTATGAVGPFRYVYIYNDTAAGDPLIGYYDYGTSTSMNSGESLTLDFASDFLTLA